MNKSSSSADYTQTFGVTGRCGLLPSARAASHSAHTRRSAALGGYTRSASTLIFPPPRKRRLCPGSSMQRVLLKAQLRGSGCPGHDRSGRDRTGPAEGTRGRRPVLRAGARCPPPRGALARGGGRRRRGPGLWQANGGSRESAGAAAARSYSSGRRAAGGGDAAPPGRERPPPGGDRPPPGPAHRPSAAPRGVSRSETRGVRRRFFLLPLSRPLGGTAEPRGRRLPGRSAPR